jgi:HlyD family secretion protein
VRVVDGNGQIQSVPVTVGLTTSSMAEIQSGIAEGDTVITGTSTALTTTTTGGAGLGGLGGLGGGAGLPPGGGTPPQGPGGGN